MGWDEVNWVLRGIRWVCFVAETHDVGGSGLSGLLLLIRVGCGFPYSVGMMGCRRSERKQVMSRDFCC